MLKRSSQPDVRNPLLTLPAAEQLRSLAPEAQAALRALLVQIAAQAGDRAEKSWRQKKAPMAAYWKAVAVYAKHAAHLLPRKAAR